jgi:hypothetical protein
MQDNRNIRNGRHQFLGIIIKGLFAVLIITAIIILLAGRIDYWQGWAYGGSCFLYISIASTLFADKAEPIIKRFNPGPGTKWWDKIFYATYTPIFFSSIIIASLDVGRYGWTMQLPLSFT